MKSIQALSQQEIQIIVHEFILTVDLTFKDCISIELLKFMKQKGIKIDNADLFNEIYDMIEEKYLSK